jgi:hypothetical protein
LFDKRVLSRNNTTAYNPGANEILNPVSDASAAFLQ